MDVLAQRIKATQNINRQRNLLALLIFLILITASLIFRLFHLALVLGILWFPYLSVLMTLIIKRGSFISLGLKNGLNVLKMRYKLQRQLLDNRSFVERRRTINDNELIVRLPKIKIAMDKEFKKGQIFIENNIKWTSTFETLNVSPALGRFISDGSSFSKDQNWLIIDILNLDYFEQLVFNSPKEYVDYIDEHTRANEWLIDQNLVQPFSHVGISGITGSGKSYMLFSLIFQAYLRSCDITIIDPKSSDITAIGQKLQLATFTTNDQIISALENVVQQLEKRQQEMTKLLSGSMAKTAFDFGLSQHIVFVDELGALISNFDSKTQKHVIGLLQQIVLKGRQLGYYLVFVTQKMDASTVPKSIVENSGLNLVLGPSGKQTLIVSFGETTTLPMDFKSGQGLYKSSSSNKIKLLNVPYLNFDLNEFTNMLSQLK